MFELPLVEEPITLLISDDESLWTLFGEIRTKEMFELVHLLHELNLRPSKEKPKQIKFVLNSIGGDLQAMLPLYDAICTSKIPIWIHVTGNCFSAATILLCAAQKRTASPTTRFMLHDLSYGFEMITKKAAKDMHAKMEEYSVLMKEIYVAKTKLTFEKITELFDSGKDNYFWAVAAKDELGLIEEVC